MARDAHAILALVTSLLQPTSAHPVDRHWARASLPELLHLLSRLRIPSHPKLETALILILRRGKLPTSDPNSWQTRLELAAAAAEPVDGGGDARHRRGGDRTAPPPPPPPPPPPLPTAFRLTQAMAALPVLSHEAWQQLSERHILARPGPLLDALTPDQTTLVAAAFARAGYHPVELFRTIAARLLSAVSRLQPGSLARALHAFAALRHHDPHLTAALCSEVHRRMRGGGAVAVGSDGGGGGGSEASAAAGSSGGVAGSSLLSLAGAALFGNRRGGGPDKAHRAPQFLLEDLARLAAAAVQLGAGDAVVRAYGSGGVDGGSGYGACPGEELLAAVAEEAEEAVSRRMRLVAAAEAAAPRTEAAAAAATAAEAETCKDHGMWAAPGSEGTGGGENGASDVAAEGDPWEDGLVDPWVGSRSGSSINPKLGGSSSSSSNSSSPAAEQLEPVLMLLEALVMGGAGSGGGGGDARAAAARAAHVIAAQYVVPELPCLEPYMSPQHLVTLLAALLPGTGAAALRQTAHPYPGPPPPPRLSYWASSSSPRSTWLAPAASGGDGSGDRQGGKGSGPADHLAAAVAALCRRIDPRVFRSAGHLIVAWHLLAAARAGGAAGTDDPRVISQLMAPVFACVVRHVAMLGSAPEAARFVVSCALLSAYDKGALDAIAAPLVAALGGGGGRQLPQRRAGSGRRRGSSSSGGDDGSSWNTAVRAAALSPAALAQLAWAVGQLGYGNEELLAAIQAHALALSSTSGLFSHHHYEPPPQQQPQPHSHRNQGDTKQQQQRQQHIEDGGDIRSGGGAAAAAAAACLTTAPPPLGPLELADVMWCLAVNQFRTNQGADLRELYLRAATQGVVRIDDPRWVRLVQVHLLLLLGWAGGLGEAAAARLRSGWFNALGYAWERQAVARGEQLAGPTGLPPDPDPNTSAFREGVAAAACDLIRSGSGGSGGGRWRLQPGYVWGMLQPSADIRLTVPLLARYRYKPTVFLEAGGFAVGGGGGGGGEWLVSLDLVRSADEAAVVPAPAPTPAAVAAAEAAEAVGSGPVGNGHSGTCASDDTPAADAAAGMSGTGAVRSHACQRQQQQGGGQGPQQQPLPPPEAGDAPSTAGGGQLLGPARWRQLVLRRLGVMVRPVRQEEWERANAGERRSMVLRALRV